MLPEKELVLSSASVDVDHDGRRGLRRRIRLARRPKRYPRAHREEIPDRFIDGRRPRKRDAYVSRVLTSLGLSVTAVTVTGKSIASEAGPVT